MSTAPTNWQVWQDRTIAHNFANSRRAGILGAEQQFEVMLDLLRYVPASPLCVLDLGCGDGILLETVMRAYPVARAVAVDGSPAMLEKAEVRFEGLGLFSTLVEFMEADFGHPDWIDHLPVMAFDAVVSGFAIHHSEDERKRALYAEIFGLLNPGGVFVNIEHVASSTSQGEELFERAYSRNLAGVRRARGEEVSNEAVYEEIAERPDKAANRLATIDAQLSWLREAGFYDADCYWKHYELAVIAGFKPKG
jgi:tRNA (cmo5U34)-methyltransferase